MPRPGPRRLNVGMRLSAAGVEWIDQRAVTEGLVKSDGSANHSALLRLALAYAQANMPIGWRPLDARRRVLQYRRPGRAHRAPLRLDLLPAR